MRAVQILEGLRSGAEDDCNGAALFDVASATTGTQCDVDPAIAASAAVVRGLTERAGSRISAFACSDDDAPDSVAPSIEVLPTAGAPWPSCTPTPCCHLLTAVMNALLAWPRTRTHRSDSLVSSQPAQGCKQRGGSACIWGGRAGGC